jgi:Protein of unknown function (DUF4232)
VTLRAVGGRQGEEGGAHGDVEFTNVGPRPCVLRGIPEVTIVRATGAPLAVRLLPPADPPLPPVVLMPRERHAALLGVYWSNWCGPSPGPLLLRITLPGNGGTLTSPFNGPPDYSYVPP